MQVTVTHLAFLHIQGILSAQAQPCVFRLGLKKSGCSGYRYDPQLVSEPEPTDHAMEPHKGWIMYIQADTEAYFDGLTLDVVEKNLGTQLIFLNPNAEDECGCGESFNLKGPPSTDNED